MSKTQPLTIAGRIASAAQQAVVTKQGRRSKDDPPVEIDITELTDAAFQAGQDDGRRADSDTAPLGGGTTGTNPTDQGAHDGHLSFVATQLVTVSLERLGRYARAAVADTHTRVATSLAAARAGRTPLSKALLVALVVLFAAAEVAAGIVAINLLFNQHEILSGLIAVTIAVVLAYTGFLLAEALSKLLPGRLVLAVAAMASVILLGFLVAGSVALRSSDTVKQDASQRLESATQAAAFGDDTNLAPAQTALDQANGDNAHGALLMFIGLIGLPIAAGVLAKSLNALDNARTTVTLDARTQRDRIVDLAQARRNVDRLSCWPTAAEELTQARLAIWDAYLSGYRSTAPNDVADRLHLSPTLAPASAPTWIQDLNEKIKAFHDAIDAAERQLALPLSEHTATDLLPSTDSIDLTTAPHLAKEAADPWDR